MSKTTDKMLQKIQSGEYLYRGCRLLNLGYINEPTSSVIWEAHDEYGCAFQWAKTLHELIENVDFELDDPDLQNCAKWNRENNEIGRLS